MNKNKIMDWYKSNKNGLHFYYYRLCKYCKSNNIEIRKDNDSFRDFVELAYYNSSRRKSDSKFDVIDGFKPKYRNFTKIMKNYKNRNKIKVLNNNNKSNILSDNSDEFSDDSIELEGIFKLEKKNGKVHMINNNKLCNLYMDTDKLYKLAQEKVFEIEKKIDL